MSGVMLAVVSRGIAVTFSSVSRFRSVDLFNFINKRVQEFKCFQTGFRKQLLSAASSDVFENTVIMVVLKKGLQALKGCSTLLNVQTRPSRHMSRN